MTQEDSCIIDIKTLKVKFFKHVEKSKEVTVQKFVNVE